MARLGHSTVSAAMRYQHAASERDAEIARCMSERHAVCGVSARVGDSRRPYRGVALNTFAPGVRPHPRGRRQARLTHWPSHTQFV
jgi:hypothetical protein